MHMQRPASAPTGHPRLGRTAQGVNGRINKPHPLNPPSSLSHLVKKANRPYTIVDSWKDVDDPYDTEVRAVYE